MVLSPFNYCNYCNYGRYGNYGNYSGAVNANFTSGTINLGFYWSIIKDDWLITVTCFKQYGHHQYPVPSIYCAHYTSGHHGHYYTSYDHCQNITSDYSLCNSASTLVTLWAEIWTSKQLCVSIISNNNEIQHLIEKNTNS